MTDRGQPIGDIGDSLRLLSPMSPKNRETWETFGRHVSNVSMQYLHNFAVARCRRVRLTRSLTMPARRKNSQRGLNQGGGPGRGRGRLHWQLSGNFTDEKSSRPLRLRKRRSFGGCCCTDGGCGQTITGRSDEYWRRLPIPSAELAGVEGRQFGVLRIGRPSPSPIIPTA